VGLCVWVGLDFILAMLDKVLEFISMVDRHLLQLGYDCLELAPERASQLS
jgi:hypothetical protein